MGSEYKHGYRRPKTRKTWAEYLKVQEEVREYGVKIKFRVPSRDYQEGSWQDKPVVSFKDRKKGKKKFYLAKRLLGKWKKTRQELDAEYFSDEYTEEDAINDALLLEFLKR